MAESYLNESRQYNNLNQLTEIDTNPQSYGYPVFMRSHFSATANNGQVMSVDDARQNGANIVYTYDALKRLTNATTAAWTQTIGYDAFGNITSKTVPPTSAEPAFPGAVSSKNWLAGVSYDLNGNALGVNAFELQYDVENRLATATSGSAVESYLYDESNHRVEKTIGSADYFYFYGPGGRLLTILQLWAGTTSLVADRVYFGGLLLGSAGSWVSADVSTMTDRLGTAETGYPYGTDIGSVSASNDQPDFATYTKDATTGFEYANQRYYSAGLGRFLTTDRSGRNVEPTNPISWNHFAYANGDPVGKSDPSGSCAEGDASCNACPEGDPGCSCPDQTCLCDPTDPTSPCYQQTCSAAANGFEPDPEAIAGPGCSGPPPPPQTAPDTCDVSLYAQSAGPSWDPFVHTDLLLTDYDPNTSASQSAYLESGPVVFNPNANWAFQVFFGHSWNNEFFQPAPLYNNKQNLVYNFASSYSSSQLCAAINVLGSEYSAYKNSTTIYRPIYGPNSNSFAGTFLRGANLTLPLLIEVAVEFYAVGWTTPLGQL